MKQHDIAVGPVLTFLDLADDEDARANGYIVEQDDAVWGRRLVVGHPFHLSDTPAVVGTRTPGLGEDTALELDRIGYTAPEIDDLVASGVVERPARRSGRTGAQPATTTP